MSPVGAQFTVWGHLAGAPVVKLNIREVSVGLSGNEDAEDMKM